MLGRVGYPEAMLRGASGGALTGALIGWLFGLFNWIDPILTGALLALYGLIFGAIVGAAPDNPDAGWSRRNRRVPLEPLPHRRFADRVDLCAQGGDERCGRVVRRETGRGDGERTRE